MEEATVTYHYGEWIQSVQIIEENTIGSNLIDCNTQKLLL